MDGSIKDENCVLLKKITRIHLSLRPNALDSLDGKVNEELESRKFQYHKDFDGMLVHYSDVRVNHSQSIFVDEEGFPHINVRLKVHIFRPVKGMVTVATVNENNKSFLDCRMFSSIPITVYKNQFQTEEEILPGDQIKVTLTEVIHMNHRTKLAGAITEVLQSATSHQHKNKKTTFSDDDETFDQIVKTEQHPRARAQINIKSEAEPTTADNTTDTSLLSPNKVKKSKKKKKRKADDDIENLNDSELNAQQNFQNSPELNVKPKKIKLEVKEEPMTDTEFSPKKKKKKRKSAHLSPSHG